jgi:hypothetical protein
VWSRADQIFLSVIRSLSTALVLAPDKLRQRAEGLEAVVQLREP